MWFLAISIRLSSLNVAPYLEPDSDYQLYFSYLRDLFESLFDLDNDS